MKPLLFVRSRVSFVRVSFVRVSFVTTASIASLALAGSIGGCGSSDSDGNGGADASTSDTGAADTGSKPHVDAGGTTPGDASTSDVVIPPNDGSADDGGTSDSGPPATDGATQSCSSASDCRLYSSACDTCACLALGKNDPDPTCTGTILTCFVDPCEGKSAKCDNGHCGGN